MFLRETGTQSGILPVVALCRSINRITHFTILIEFVPKVNPLSGIQIIKLSGDLAPTEGGIITDVVLAMGAFLRGDDNHTIGTTRTIDSGSRNVLQHFDALDIRGVQERQGVKCGITGLGTCTGRGRIVIHDEAIDHVERFVTTGDTITTTDADDAGSTRLTRGLCDVQTCHSTLQGTLNRIILLTEDFITYRRNATGQLQALLGTISHNHHFVKFAGVINQRYLHGLLEVIDIHIEGAIAYIFHTEGQRSLHLRLEGEVTIVVGHDTLTLFTLYNHGCTNQGFTSANICDMTCNQVLRYSQQGANRNECCNKQSLYHKFKYLFSLFLRGKYILYLFNLYLGQFVVQIQQSKFMIKLRAVCENPLQELIHSIVTTIITHANLLDGNL